MRISLLALILLAFGCNKANEPSPPAATEPNAPSTPEPSPAAAPQKPAQAAAAAGGLTWDAPSSFARREPKSSMRVAEYGVTGEPNAELSVFYFGVNQGGSIEDNMTRWVGQFSQPDGSPTKPKRSERTVNGVDVALVEAVGTFGGGMSMPGMPAKPAQQDAMLLGAIAKGPQGAVFFKFTGPRVLLEGSRGSFDVLVASLRPAP